ncbi:MAG: tRNA (N6-isopentenyl adenosine(37)-C2)-methylthiotransferase MiaB [Lachnospiraceae bacterium]|nr:tRNA (N6-isopentenyl adenosine(37)-C2)-methylthiotransferase MiaB [Lachnospiraceae bacterium]
MFDNQRLEAVDIHGEIPEKEPERQYYYMKKCREWAEEKKRQIGRPLTVSIQTLGCQMNARDSEKMEAVLEYIGYEPVEEPVADFVLYNTCTVRENANLKIYGRLGYLKNQKEKNPDMRIALCGCMMQEADEVERVRKSYPFVDIVFGTHNIYKLAELFYLQIQSEGRVMDVWEKEGEIVEDLPGRRKYSFKTGVNIMYGCNNFCSYCIVPYVRGRERSREPQDILEEIRGLVEDGVTEVMLLGQNVNSYGKTLKEKLTFAELLRKVNQIDGLQRIRFMTSHPKDLSQELIEAMGDCEKVCRHLHLPLQSGSSVVLQKMNRRYTKEDYLALVEKIRKKVPDISLTTDIIVGFPGETEEDFEETLDVVKKVRYDSAYTFIYSKRSGTPAAAMEGQVPQEVVKARFDRLLKVIQGISAEITASRLNQTVEVLFEEVNSQDSTLITGRLSNNAIVHCPGTSDRIGQILPVKLTESKGFYYMGEIVSGSS